MRSPPGVPPPPPTVFAIGDIHGDWARFEAVLTAAGLATFSFPDGRNPGDGEDSSDEESEEEQQENSESPTEEFRYDDGSADTTRTPGASSPEQDSAREVGGFSLGSVPEVEQRPAREVEQRPAREVEQASESSGRGGGAICGDSSESSGRGGGAASESSGQGVGAASGGKTTTPGSGGNGRVLRRMATETATIPLPKPAQLAVATPTGAHNTNHSDIGRGPTPAPVDQTPSAPQQRPPPRTPAPPPPGARSRPFSSRFYELEWTGGDSTVVFLGDIVDRGPSPFSVYVAIAILKEQAEKAGGRVELLFGNHEVMRMGGDITQVGADDLASLVHWDGSSALGWRHRLCIGGRCSSIFLSEFGIGVSS